MTDWKILRWYLRGSGIYGGRPGVNAKCEKSFEIMEHRPSIQKTMRAANENREDKNNAMRGKEPKWNVIAGVKHSLCAAGAITRKPGAN